MAGQQVSIVSDVPGTTTDPVAKAVEIPGLGPCILTDTAGLDDAGVLGQSRLEKARDRIAGADIVVLVCSGSPEALPLEQALAKDLERSGKPFVAVLGKSDLLEDPAARAGEVAASLGTSSLPVSAVTGDGIGELFSALLEKVPKDFGARSLLGGLAGRGDLVVLVMPQDSEAPKGRLIMPQVQVLRELLDAGGTSVCCTPDTFAATLAALSRKPDLVIVDSSVFGEVSRLVPEGTKLTSFSVLMAAYKGDIRYFVSSASAIGRLVPGDRVLIAESCSHVPLGEDIGRVKISNLLRKYLGERYPDRPRDSILSFDIVSGRDFPSDLHPYALVIHCGGCVFSRMHLLARVESARRQGVPMTNYGIAIAFLKGILPEVAIPEDVAN
jgi:[FeFe] hydrogenase H-cluster maturation GTPase HydF